MASNWDEPAKAPGGGGSATNGAVVDNKDGIFRLKIGGTVLSANQVKQLIGGLCVHTPHFADQLLPARRRDLAPPPAPPCCVLRRSDTRIVLLAVRSGRLA